MNNKLLYLLSALLLSPSTGHIVCNSSGKALHYTQDSIQNLLRSNDCLAFPPDKEITFQGIDIPNTLFEKGETYVVIHEGNLIVSNPWKDNTNRILTSTNNEYPYQPHSLLKSRDQSFASTKYSYSPKENQLLICSSTHCTKISYDKDTVLNIDMLRKNQSCILSSSIPLDNSFCLTLSQAPGTTTATNPKSFALKPSLTNEKAIFLLFSDPFSNIGLISPDKSRSDHHLFDSLYLSNSIFDALGKIDYVNVISLTKLLEEFEKKGIKVSGLHTRVVLANYLSEVNSGGHRLRSTKIAPQSIITPTRVFKKKAESWQLEDVTQTQLLHQFLIETEERVAVDSITNINTNARINPLANLARRNNANIESRDTLPPSKDSWKNFQHLHSVHFTNKELEAIVEKEEDDDKMNSKNNSKNIDYKVNLKHEIFHYILHLIYIAAGVTILGMIYCCYRNMKDSEGAVPQGTYISFPRNTQEEELTPFAARDSL